MIFRRRKKDEATEDSQQLEVVENWTPVEAAAETKPDAEPASAAESAPEAAPEAATDAEADDTEERLAKLDAGDWRTEGPHDISEVTLDEDDSGARIDLGGMIVTGAPGAELRLQVSEETQQVVSAMLLLNDSALELGVYAAPRSRGFWPELRAEIIEDTVAAGGSVALAEGPFGVELRRLVPVQTPDGQQGYQPSRMWVVEGPRWVLRGIVYGQAALNDSDVPQELVTAFRRVVVRRGAEAIAPGDPVPLQLPAGLQPAPPA